MADGADNTLLIVAAAAVVVAVVWSRRASAAPAGGMYAGGSARGAQLETDSATGFLEGFERASKAAGGAAKAFGDLFSGFSDRSRPTSSTDDYTIPAAGTTGTARYGAESFVGEGCSDDFQCGFGEVCYLGKCMSEAAFVQMEREKLV